MNGRHRRASTRMTSRRSRMSLRTHIRDDPVERPGRQLHGPILIFHLGTHGRRIVRHDVPGPPANIRLNSLHDQLRRMSISEMILRHKEV